MNNIVLIGRLVRDPELRYGAGSGVAVAKFTLAIDKDLYGEKKQEAIRQGKPTADFINIAVFGKMAENCAQYMAKGSQCAIQGRLTINNYTNDKGEKRISVEILASKVEFLSSKKSENTTSAADFINDDDKFLPLGDDDEIPF